MLYTVNEIAFACYSATCRPPGKNGGTGGSLKGGAYDAPISPAARKSMRALKGDADALAKDANHVLTDDEIKGLEPRVTAFGQRVHAALEKVLASDTDLSTATKRADDAVKLVSDASAAWDQMQNRRQALFEGSMGRDYTPEERTETDKLVEQMSVLDRKIRAASRGVSDLRRAVLERRASVIGQALNEIVPMGGEFAGVGKHLPRKDKWGKVALTVNEIMTYTAKVYPKNWIDVSNDHATQPHDNNLSSSEPSMWYRTRPLTFRKTGSRAHYIDTKPVTGSSSALSAGQFVDITNPIAKAMLLPRTQAYASVRFHSEITLDNDMDTGVHEMAHRMEHMFPTVMKLERSFLDRRSGGTKPVWLGKGYKKDEVYTPDNLFHKYAEKVYDDGYREVMSMGWEYYVSGKTSSDRTTGGRPDPEHMGLILGMLTTVRTTTKPRKMTRR